MARCRLDPVRSTVLVVILSSVAGECGGARAVEGEQGGVSAILRRTLFTRSQSQSNDDDEGG